MMCSDSSSIILAAGQGILQLEDWVLAAAIKFITRCAHELAVLLYKHVLYPQSHI